MVLITLPEETRWESSTLVIFTMGPAAMRTSKESSKDLRHHIFSLLMLCRIFASKGQCEDGIFRTPIGIGKVIEGTVHVVVEGAG